MLISVSSDLMNNFEAAPSHFLTLVESKDLYIFVTMKLLRFTKKAILQFKISTNPNIWLDLQFDNIVSNASGSINLLDMLKITEKVS